LLPPLSILLFVLAGLIAYYFLSGFIWGAGYAPTSAREVGKVASLIDLKKDDTFYDLGCGYGRLIFAMAQRCDAQCVGVEIDPIKCWWIRRMIKRKNLGGRVRIIHSNFLDFNLMSTEKAFVFLSNATSIMTKLRDKMFREMKPGARVVSYSHRFADWNPEKIEGNLYLYLIPESGSSRESKTVATKSA
jgi:16S rRNA A1518/A1519 N6-dimethyltransferase RsmA/KsgA/DIM1 with predicted DNA glycosylase/AP lyase activity